MTKTSLETLLQEVRSLATAQDLVDHAWLDSILSVLPPAIRTRLPHPDAPGDRLEQVFAGLAITGPPADGMTPLVKVAQRLALEPSADIVADAQRLLDELARHPIEVRPGPDEPAVE